MDEALHKRVRHRPSWMPKRSVTFGNWKTSVSLEDEFWHETKMLAFLEGEKRGRFVSVGELVSEIEAERAIANTGQRLSSAIRVRCLNEARKRAGESAADKRDDLPEALHHVQ